jgi:hypothetical protein
MQRKAKFTSKTRKGEPEVISGSTKPTSSAALIAEREKLAKTLKKMVDEAFSPCLKKLAELRPMITELRQHFMKLKPGETIAGVGTWTAYCQTILRRSDRRVRQIMEGANPASEKHARKSLPAPKETKALKTVKLPKIQVPEWTSESVVDTSFSIVNAVLQEAKLSDGDRKRAIEQLIDRLKEVVLGNLPLESKGPVQ